MQNKDISIQEATSCSQCAINYLKRLRNDSSFDEFFYTTAIKLADGHTGEPSLPRYRKPPRRLDEGSTPHQFSTPKDYYRYHYYYCLDLLIGEISDRLAQDSLNIPMELEKLLIFAANNESNSERPLVKRGFTEFRHGIPPC